MKDLTEGVAAIFDEAADKGEERYYAGEGLRLVGARGSWAWRPDKEMRRAAARQSYAKRTKSLRAKRPVYRITPDGQQWEPGAPAAELPPPPKKRNIIFWHQIEAAAKLLK